jgi:hypothetical protein
MHACNGRSDRLLGSTYEIDAQGWGTIPLSRARQSHCTSTGVFVLCTGISLLGPAPPCEKEEGEGHACSQVVVVKWTGIERVSVELAHSCLCHLLCACSCMHAVVTCGSERASSLHFTGRSVPLDHTPYRNSACGRWRHACMFMAGVLQLCWFDKSCKSKPGARRPSRATA